MTVHERANPLYEAAAGKPPIGIENFIWRSRNAFFHHDWPDEFKPNNLDPLMQNSGMFAWLTRIKDGGVPLDERMVEAVEEVMNSLLFKSPFFGYIDKHSESKRSGPKEPKFWESHNHSGYKPGSRIARVASITRDLLDSSKMTLLGEELDTLVYLSP